MQRFELGLSYEIQKHIEIDRYDTLDQLYKRAAQIWNVIRKEQEKLAHSGDKRREPMFQNAESGSNHAQNHFKKHKTYGVIKKKCTSQDSQVKVGEVRYLRPGYRNHFMTAMERKEFITVGDARKIIQGEIVGEH